MFNGMGLAGLRRTTIAAASVLALGAGAAVFATSAASAAPAAAGAKPAATPACTAQDLAVWINISEANGAAGTIYYPLDFTNISNHACTLDGYPGVSALGSKDQQLGAAASWDPEYKATVVTLAAGATAHTDLGWVDVYNYPASTCKPTESSLIKVYPPGQKGYVLGLAGLEACASKAAPYLHTTVVRPGPNGD